MLQIQDKEDDHVRLLEHTIRSQINVFKYWTGEPPHANYMVNVLESLLKSPVFQVQVKEEENSDEEGQGQLEDNREDDYDDPLFSPSSQSQSDLPVRPSSTSLILSRTQKSLENKKTTSTNYKLRKKPPKPTMIDLNSDSSSNEDNVDDDDTTFNPIETPTTTFSLIIPVDKVEKDKSSRGREIRILDGYIFNFNRLNNSGSQSWICRNRCGAWALEKDGEFRLTKMHSSDCQNKPEKKKKNTKKRKKTESVDAIEIIETPLL